MSNLPDIKMRYLSEKDLSGRVKFISFSKVRDYCQGILVLEVDGREVEFPRGSLISGGEIKQKEWYQPISIDAWTIVKWTKNS